MLESFDSLAGWKVIKGDGALARDAQNKAQGRASMAFDNEQNDGESWAEKRFDGTLDLSDVAELRIWILQEGNLLAGGPWRMRLITTRSDYYEHAFPPQTIAEATRWCQESSKRSRWEKVGNASWSRIVGVQVGVPGYVAGARNYVHFDAFSALR